MILNPTTRALLLIGQAIECVTSSNHTFRVRVTFWINRSEVRSLQQATVEENRVCTIWQSPFKFFSDFISFPFYLVRPPFSKESDWVAVKKRSNTRGSWRFDATWRSPHCEGRRFWAFSSTGRQRRRLEFTVW